MDSARRESLRKAQERFRAKKKEGGKVNVQLYISKSTLDKVKKIRGDEPRLKLAKDQSIGAYLEDILEEFAYRKSALNDLQTLPRNTTPFRSYSRQIKDINERLDQEKNGLMIDELKDFKLPNELAYTREEVLQILCRIEAAIGVEK